MFDGPSVCLFIFNRYINFFPGILCSWNIYIQFNRRKYTQKTAKSSLELNLPSNFELLCTLSIHHTAAAVSGEQHANDLNADISGDGARSAGVRKRIMCTSGHVFVWLCVLCVRCFAILKNGTNLIPNQHFRHSHPTRKPMTAGPNTEFTLFSPFSRNIYCVCLFVRLAFRVDACVCTSRFYSAPPKKRKTAKQQQQNTRKFRWWGWYGVKNENVCNVYVLCCVCVPEPVFPCMWLFGRPTSGGVRFSWKIV